MENVPDNLSPKELGRLFPIIIVQPDPEWPDIFESEQGIILKTLNQSTIVRIEHIGSTAVPNLKAKPTIDILMEIKPGLDLQEVIEKLNMIGYHYISRPENPPPHAMFVKGYTSHGFNGQAFHIHVRFPGDWDEIYFRDYLRKHEQAAQEYGELKDDLSVKFRNDREGYTQNKSAFIRRIMAMAKKEVISRKY